MSNCSQLWQQRVRRVSMGAQPTIHVVWAMLFTHCPPDEQWLISMGLGPPSLFAGGIGAGIMVPLLPLIFCTHEPPYEQMLVGVGLVLVSPLPPVSCSPSSRPPSHLPPWSSSQVVIIVIMIHHQHPSTP